MFLCTAWVEQRNCTAAWRRVVAIPGGARPHHWKHTPQHGHRPKKVLGGRGGGVCECESVCGVLGGGRLLGGGGGKERPDMDPLAG